MAKKSTKVTRARELVDSAYVLVAQSEKTKKAAEAATDDLEKLVLLTQAETEAAQAIKFSKAAKSIVGRKGS